MLSHRRECLHRTWIAVAGICFWLAASSRAIAGDVNAFVVGQWDGYSGAYCDVWGDGDYAYLPNWGLADGNAARVHTIDISDPTQPTLAHTLFMRSPNRFASPQDVKSGDGLLLVALEGDGNDGVAIADIRDPPNARVIGTVRLPGYQDVHNLFYHEGYLYLTGPSEIAIVDLTGFDPDAPPSSTITTAKWFVSNIGTSNVHDVTVKDGRMYVAAWGSGLWVYDITDIANTPPTFLGSTPGISTHSMWPTDDGRFVVTGEERSLGGIKVYEMTDNGTSLTFTLRDSIASPPSVFSVHNQVVIGNRLYNSWYEMGLVVYDIDPVTGLLELVARYDTSTAGLGNWGVYPFFGDSKILASDGINGLLILSLGTPPLPIPLPAAPPFDFLTNRYVSFEPNVTFRVAIEVRMIDGPGGAGPLGWVGAPDGNGVARVVDAPYFSGQWPETVHLGACQIVPSATYGLRLSADGVEFSETLTLATSMYGDAVGTFDEGAQLWTAPQGIVNFLDISAAVQSFQSDVSAPHKRRVDLGGQTPNWVVNFSDIALIVAGFQEQPYPPVSWDYPTPKDCP